MAKKKRLKVNGEEIDPIVHEKDVYDSQGNNIPKKYVERIKLPDFSSMVSKQEIGNLANLSSNSTDIVSAINAVKQKSDDQRLQIINILKNIGCTELTNNSSWDSVISYINSDSFKYSMKDDDTLPEPGSGDPGIYLLRYGELVNEDISGGVYQPTNAVWKKTDRGMEVDSLLDYEGTAVVFCFNNKIDMSQYSEVEITYYIYTDSYFLDFQDTIFTGVYMDTAKHNQAYKDNWLYNSAYNHSNTESSKSDGLDFDVVETDSCFCSWWYQNQNNYLHVQYSFSQNNGMVITDIKLVY
jgi:hypothetical protein